MDEPLYKLLAAAIAAGKRCERQDTLTEWAERWPARAEALAREYLPSGSGFDAGTAVDWKASKLNRIVLVTSFHHRDDAGYYAGWTHHTVIVTPDMAWDYDLRITGSNRNGIKDYMAEHFADCLSHLRDYLPD